MERENGAARVVRWCAAVSPCETVQRSPQMPQRRQTVGISQGQTSQTTHVASWGLQLTCAACCHVAVATTKTAQEHERHAVKEAGLTVPQGECLDKDGATASEPYLHSFG